MVATARRLISLTAVLPPLLAAEAEPQRPLLWRLDQRQQADVLMALLGVVLVGAALVALVMIGGRRLRRIARQRAGSSRLSEDAWYRKPIAPIEPGEQSGENGSAD